MINVTSDRVLQLFRREHALSGSHTAFPPLLASYTLAGLNAVYPPDAANPGRLARVTDNPADVVMLDTGSAWKAIGYRLPASPSADSLGVNSVERGLTFVGLNNASVLKRYANVTGRIHTDTAGAEKGELWFWVNDVDALIPVARFDNDGRFIVSPSGGTGRTGAVQGLTVFMRGDSADEVQLELENIFTAAVGNRSQAYFSALDSADNEQTYAIIRMETTNVTNGAEESKLQLMTTRNGSVGREYVELDANGWLWHDRRRVVAKTGNYSIDADHDSNTTFTNNGAAGTIVFSLPAITDSGISRNIGSTYTFITTEAQIIDIDPSGSQAIHPTPTTGGNRLRSSAAAGNSVTLVALGQNRWQITSQIGTWSDGGA